MQDNANSMECILLQGWCTTLWQCMPAVLLCVNAKIELKIPAGLPVVSADSNNTFFLSFLQIATKHFGNYLPQKNQRGFPDFKGCFFSQLESHSFVTILAKRISKCLGSADMYVLYVQISNISMGGSRALDTFVWDKDFARQGQGWCHGGCKYEVFWTFWERALFNGLNIQWPVPKKVSHRTTASCKSWSKAANFRNSI